jgi:NADPH:quinone reductase
MAATTMQAVVLDGPGPAGALQIRNVPVPNPSAGWALIAVKAFGLNRAELHSRLGLAEDMAWPRVLGAEAVGVIEACPGGEFSPGQQVAALAGGMGRVFDGGYAEYTCVPVSQVVPFTSSLNWPTLGAIPVMLLTANGSLDVGLDAKGGQTILVRGGTSSIGMLTAVLAKQRGMTVLSTTRNASKASSLDVIGVDQVVIDDGNIAKVVRRLYPDGVDAALELIGAPTLPDTLRCVRVHGVVCFTGILSNQWTVEKFYPIDYIPRGVRLTAYGGDAPDLPPTVLQGFIEDVEAGRVKVPIAHVFRLEEIVEAHQAMEDGSMSGKLVVTTGL